MISFELAKKLKDAGFPQSEFPRAQQKTVRYARMPTLSTLPIIGFVRSESLADVAHLVTAFRLGLKEAGLIEGQNVTIEYRSAEGDRDRLKAIVSDFTHRPVSVIVANVIAAACAASGHATAPPSSVMNSRRFNFAIIR